MVDRKPAFFAKQDWTVRLGPLEWSRYTSAHKETTGMKLIGSVMRGAGVGALALMADGSYVQVNGDFVSPPLKGKKIRRALAQAKAFHARAARTSKPVAPPAAPVVLVKRRRSLAAA